MTESRKKIGPLLATCIVAGNMIGSGIFLLPASLASVGAGSLIGWLFAAFAASVLAAIYGMLAVHRPSDEGLIDYPARALHPAAGFAAWAAYWSACWTGNVAIVLAAVGYLAALLSTEFARDIETLLVVGLIWVIAVLNIIGPRFVGRLAAATLAIGLVPIVAAMLVGIIKFEPDIFAASWNVSGKPLLQSTPPIVLTIFWAFLGLESANAVSSAVENPKRTVPFAAVAGTLAAAVIYALASTALFGLIPAETLQESSAPFADAIVTAIGPMAGVVVAGAAFARTFGCVAGWVFVTAEANRAGAADGYLPSFMSGAKRADDSRRDVVVVCLLMTITTIATVSPTLNQQFTFIIDLSVLLFLLVYSLSSLSLITFTKEFSNAKDRLYGRLLGAGGAFVSLLIAGAYLTG